MLLALPWVFDESDDYLEVAKTVERIQKEINERNL